MEVFVAILYYYGAVVLGLLLYLYLSGKCIVNSGMKLVGQILQT